MRKRKEKSKDIDIDNVAAATKKPRRQLIEEKKILDKARQYLDRKPDQGDTFSIPNSVSTPISSNDRYIDDSTYNKKGDLAATSYDRKKVKTTKCPERKVCVRTRALQYLNSWSNKDANWKYKKKLHAWFLQNMYKKAVVSDDLFQMLLEYLDSLEGTPRSTVIQQAERVMKDCEHQMGPTMSEIPKACLTSYERARQILQLIV